MRSVRGWNVAVGTRNESMALAGSLRPPLSVWATTMPPTPSTICTTRDAARRTSSAVSAISPE